MDSSQLMVIYKRDQFERITHSGVVTSFLCLGNEDTLSAQGNDPIQTVVAYMEHMLSSLCVPMFISACTNAIIIYIMKTWVLDEIHFSLMLEGFYHHVVIIKMSTSIHPSS